jgi:hypothetical protein
MTFIMICALLIVSLFFLSSPPPLLYYSGFSLLALMWLMGMIDAYVDDEFLMGSGRWLTWQKSLAILPIVVIFAAVALLMLLWMQDFSAVNRRTVASASNRTSPHDQVLQNESDRTEIDMGIAVEPGGVELGSSDFFSIQIASFRELPRAEEAHSDLLSKGYTADIEQTISADKTWHRVLVGTFLDEQDAIEFTNILYEREGFSNMVIRRRSPKVESEHLP